jgi:hypothetical protein
MLTDQDTPTIRHAITRRLSLEPGVTICDIKFGRFVKGDWYAMDDGMLVVADEPFLRVGVLATIDDGDTITRSRFDLPAEFEHGHLVAEIDEIAEQYKAARKERIGHGGGLILTPERQLQGSGLRGRWSRYGLREPQNG